MFGLAFLSPAFLIGALVAALPIALHLLGRRPDLRVLFPPVRLLKLAPAQEARRRRLRELVLLALRVTAIFLLAAAFARPFFARPVVVSVRSTLIVALDRSFSMSAPGQIDRARSLAREAVADAGPGTAVGLLTFDDDAELIVRPGGDRTAVLRAVARVQPGYGGTSYAVALARAAEAVGSGSGRIVVVTDLQRSGWDRRDAAIPDRIDVVVRDTGGPSSNLAISDLARHDTGLTAVVRNSGTGRRTGHARLSVAGRVRAVMPFAVDAGSVQEITFPGPVPATGEAVAEIDDAIGYEADNKAYALLDPPDPTPLLAITAQADPSRGSFYLQRALEVDDRRLFHLDTEAATSFSAHASPSALAGYAGVFLLGMRGLSNAAADTIGDYVTRGGGVLVALDDQADSVLLDRVFGSHLPISVRTVADSTASGLVPIDARHPVLQSLDADAFGAVHFQRVVSMNAQREVVVARFGDGSPALVEHRRGDGRILLFGSDLSNRWNDLPLQPAFLPLVHQVGRYLARDRAPARDFLVSATPKGVPHQPGVMTVPASASAPTAIPGGASSPRRIVVNIDPHESDVSRTTADQFVQMIARAGTGPARRAAVDNRQAEQQQGLWRLAIALAIAALLAEGLIGKAART